MRENLFDTCFDANCDKRKGGRGLAHFATWRASTGSTNFTARIVSLVWLRNMYWIFLFLFYIVIHWGLVCWCCELMLLVLG